MTTHRSESARIWMISGTAGTAAEFDPLDAVMPDAAHRWSLPAVHSVAEAVRQLTAALTGTAPTLLIGHSAGGIVAAHVALTLARTRGGRDEDDGSDTTPGLVLLDSNMPAEPAAVLAKQRRLHLDTGPRIPSRREFLESMAASVGAAPETLREQIMQRMRDAAATEVRTHFWPDVLAQDTVQLWDELAAAGVPVLYIQSTRPVAAETVARRHPDAVVRRVDDAGHWVHVTHPMQVARIIRDWRR